MLYLPIMDKIKQNRPKRGHWKLFAAVAAGVLCLQMPVRARAQEPAELLMEAGAGIAEEAGQFFQRMHDYCVKLDGRWEDQKDTTWSIRVNLTTNTVTVFRGKVAVKAFACASGLREGSTPVGNFQLKDKLRWHELVGPSWGQWCSHITGDILFHTLPYYSPNDKFTMRPEEYNQIGENSSHGCLRLTASCAKYLYDSCPVGTAVTIFNGTSKDDPLGRPMPLFVGDWTGAYDPTDITIAQDDRSSDGMWETWSRPMVEYMEEIWQRLGF